VSWILSKAKKTILISVSIKSLQDLFEIVDKAGNCLSDKRSEFPSAKNISKRRYCRYFSIFLGRLTCVFAPSKGISVALLIHLRKHVTLLLISWCRSVTVILHLVNQFSIKHLFKETSRFRNRDTWRIIDIHQTLHYVGVTIRLVDYSFCKVSPNKHLKALSFHMFHDGISPKIVSWLLPHQTIFQPADILSEDLRYVMLQPLLFWWAHNLDNWHKSDQKGLSAFTIKGIERIET